MGPSGLLDPPLIVNPKPEDFAMEMVWIADSLEKLQETKMLADNLRLVDFYFIAHNFWLSLTLYSI